MEHNFTVRSDHKFLTGQDLVGSQAPDLLKGLSKPNLPFVASRLAHL